MARYVGWFCIACDVICDVRVFTCRSLTSLSRMHTLGAQCVRCSSQTGCQWVVDPDNAKRIKCTSIYKPTKRGEWWWIQSAADMINISRGVWWRWIAMLVFVPRFTLVHRYTQTGAYIHMHARTHQHVAVTFTLESTSDATDPNHWLDSNTVITFTPTGNHHLLPRCKLMCGLCNLF